MFHGGRERDSDRERDEDRETGIKRQVKRDRKVKEISTTCAAGPQCSVFSIVVQISAVVGLCNIVSSKM